MFTLNSARYQIQSKLGEGGMGEVWLAHDTVLQRPVAIKTLPPSPDPFYRDQLIQEARLLAKLSHPNIVAVYDAAFDEAQQQFYFVMEYVEGPTLYQHLKHLGSLPPETSLDITLSLLRALHYAHTRGVVHRDIKPANIMMVGADVKLADFGIADLTARLLAGQGEAIGTEGYMAPEQAAGRPSDHRCDLYSVGVVLFRMLTARSPIGVAGASAQAPIRLRAVWPAAPLMLEQVLHRLLAPNPAERYNSSEEVSHVLRTLRSQLSRATTPAPLLEAPPVVGREPELRQLEAAWTQTQQNQHPQLMLVTGERGMGKHRLVVEFLRTVTAQGVPCFSGLGDELQTPYQPIAEALASLLQQGRLPLPTTPEAGSLLRLLPQLRPHWPPLAPTPARSPQQTQWEGFATLVDLLGQVGPLVLYLQDVAPLDEASAALLGYLLRRGNSPTFIIITTPTEDLLQNLPTGVSVPSVRLAPLNADQLNAHLTEIFESLFSAEAVEAVQRRSQGNVWYAEEIVRDWARNGVLARNPLGYWGLAAPITEQVVPPTLAQVLKRQLDKLTPEHRHALTVAALLGAEFDFHVWQAALGAQGTSLLAVDALDRALSLPIVREVGLDRYAFYPADSAQLLREALSSPRRHLLHEQIAAQLVQRQADPLAIAHHLEQAGANAAAAQALETAAQRAMGANAQQQAIALYHRAVQLHETLARQETLGQLYRRTGQAAAARTTLQRAITLARAAADHEAEGRCLNALAHVLWTFDQFKEAYQTAASVLRLPGVSLGNVANARSHLGMVAWQMGHLAEAEDHCRQALSILQANQHLTGLDNAYNRLGLVWLAQGRYVEAETMFQRAQALRQAQQDKWGEAYARLNRARLALERGDWALTAALLESSRQLFEEVDSAEGRMVIATQLGKLSLAQNQGATALAHFETAAQLAYQIGKRTSYGLTEIYLCQARAYLALGQPEVARPLLDESLQLATAAGTQEYEAQGQLLQAELAAATGQLETAATTFQAVIQRYQHMGYRPGALRAQTAYARFLHVHQQPAVAATLAQTAQAEAQRLGLAL